MSSMERERVAVSVARLHSPETWERCGTTISAIAGWSTEEGSGSVGASDWLRR